jgi:hypothetical protein
VPVDKRAENNYSENQMSARKKMIDKKAAFDIMRVANE